MTLSVLKKQNNFFFKVYVKQWLLIRHESQVCIIFMDYNNCYIIQYSRHEVVENIPSLSKVRIAASLLFKHM